MARFGHVSERDDVGRRHPIHARPLDAMVAGSSNGKVLFAIALVLGGLAVAGDRLGWLDQKGKKAGAADLAPDFTLEDLRGRSVSLHGLQGKVVLINFWATWCAPCLEEMPSLESMWGTLQGQPFVVLAVSADTSRAYVREVVGARRLTFPVLLDPAETVSKRFATGGYPESFLIDGAGRVVRRYVGPQKWDSPEVLGAIVAEISKVRTSGRLEPARAGEAAARKP